MFAPARETQPARSHGEVEPPDLTQRALELRLGEIRPRSAGQRHDNRPVEVGGLATHDVAAARGALDLDTVEGDAGRRGTDVLGRGRSLTLTVRETPALTTTRWAASR